MVAQGLQQAGCIRCPGADCGRMPVHHRGNGADVERMLAADSVWSLTGPVPARGSEVSRRGQRCGRQPPEAQRPEAPRSRRGDATSQTPQGLYCPADGTAHLCDAVLCWRVNTRDCCDDAPSSLARASSVPSVPEPDCVSWSTSAALLRPIARRKPMSWAAPSPIKGAGALGVRLSASWLRRALVLVCDDS